MTVDGGAKACDTMVQQDVMTPLFTLLQHVRYYYDYYSYSYLYIQQN